MSECKSRGVHYTVKNVKNNETYGVECLICGKTGDLEEVRSLPCTPASPEELLRAVVCDASAARELQLKLDQEEMDQRLALELRALEEQEVELARLQQQQQRQQAHKEQQELLDMLLTEECYLQGLLREQKVLQMEKELAARNVKVPALPEMPQRPNLEVPEPFLQEAAPSPCKLTEASSASPPPLEPLLSLANLPFGTTAANVDSCSGS